MAENFFTRIFGSLFGGNGPDAEKKRMLKFVAKNISKSKFKYYKPSSKQVETSFVKLFYELYKAISPAKIMFQSTTPKAMKNVVLDTSLSDVQKEALSKLSDGNIQELSKSLSLKELRKEVDKNLAILSHEFVNTSRKIDDLYNNLILFYYFCSFDFYFTCRKFDSSIKEGDFTRQPHFVAIGGNYVVDDIKNFIYVAWPLLVVADWTDVFELLKRIKGTEPVNPALWKKIIARLMAIKESKIMEMMIQHITDNPYKLEEPRFTEENIVNPFINEIKTAAEKALSSVQATQTKNKIGELATVLFGKTTVAPLKNYCEDMSITLTKKNAGSFRYIEPMSYMKAFLSGFVGELNSLSDILIVRGKWTDSHASNQMSESNHQIMDIAKSVLEFDASLAEDGVLGHKIKTFLPRAERDKDSADILRTAVKDANNTAAKLIYNAQKYMIAYDKDLKLLLEDYAKVPKSVIVMNWPELSRFSEGQLKAMVITVYKKIYTFVSLLQNFPIELPGQIQK